MFRLIASTILIIGDSHTVGPFGQKLDQLLRDEGAKVATYASCGSIAKWWYSGQKTTCGYFENDLSGTKTEAATHTTPLFPELLQKINPDHIIIALGTNYVRNLNDDSVIADLSLMMNDIRSSGADCFWILPPDMRQFRGELPRLNRLVKAVSGDECRYLESASITRYPESGGDGIHYWSPEGTPLARAWAIEAAKVFLAN